MDPELIREGLRITFASQSWLEWTEPFFESVPSWVMLLLGPPIILSIAWTLFRLPIELDPKTSRGGPWPRDKLARRVAISVLWFAANLFLFFKTCEMAGAGHFTATPQAAPLIVLTSALGVTMAGLALVNSWAKDAEGMMRHAMGTALAIMFLLFFPVVFFLDV